MIEKIDLHSIYIETLSKFLNGELSLIEEKKIIFCHYLADGELFFHKIYSRISLRKNKKNVFDLFEKQRDWFYNFIQNYKKTKTLNTTELENFIKELIDEIYFNTNEYIFILNILSLENELFLIHQSLTICILALIVALHSSKSVLKILIKKLNPNLLLVKETDIIFFGKIIFNEDDFIDLGMLCLLQNISMVDNYIEIKSTDTWNYKNFNDYRYYMENTKKIFERNNLKKLANFIQIKNNQIFNYTSQTKAIRLLDLINRFYILSFRNPFFPGKGMISGLLSLNKEKSKYSSYFFSNLIQCISSYPVGNFVILNTGESGIIIHNNPKPKIMIFFSKQRTQIKTPFIVDLKKYNELKITSIPEYAEISHTYRIIQNHLDFM